MIFGANGHPITQSPYTLPTYAEQIRLLTSLHLTHYRVDVPLESDLSGRIRLPSSSQNFSLLLELAAAASPPVTVLPIIFPTDLPYSNLSWSALQNVSRGEGERWARLYGHLFSVFELSNERDNVCIVNSDGVSQSGYNATCLHHLTAQMTGFAAGVKAVRPQLRIIVDNSWTHWGYLDALVDAGMQWDIFAPHWYSNMGAINRTYNAIPDVLQHVIDRYGKPLWMTETNTGDGSMHASPAEQSAYVTQSLAIARAYPALQAYIMYELFDEPQWGNATGEAFFGLFAGDGHGERTVKAVGKQLGASAAEYASTVCAKGCVWVSDTSSELRCADGMETQTAGSVYSEE